MRNRAIFLKSHWQGSKNDAWQHACQEYIIIPEVHLKEKHAHSLHPGFLLFQTMLHSYDGLQECTHQTADPQGVCHSEHCRFIHTYVKNGSSARGQAASNRFAAKKNVPLAARHLPGIDWPVLLKAKKGMAQLCWCAK